MNKRRTDGRRKMWHALLPNTIHYKKKQWVTCCIWNTNDDKTLWSNMEYCIRNTRDTGYGVVDYGDIGISGYWISGMDSQCVHVHREGVSRRPVDMYTMAVHGGHLKDAADIWTASRLRQSWREQATRSG